MIDNDPPMNIAGPEPDVYHCPKHGDVVDTLHSSLPENRGHWCLLCYLEVLEKLGVNRVHKIPKRTSY